MTDIFTAILKGFVSDGKEKLNTESLASHIVKYTVEMYLTITKELLPTPTKSHYTFNLRDISKVF
jgi:dynein heavy chain